MWRCRFLIFGDTDSDVPDLRPVECPACGDRSATAVRCTFEQPWLPCDAPGGEHLHLLCARCGSERVALLGAGELACLASQN